MRRKPILGGLALAAGALCVGGVAYATIPGAGGVINGCYEKRTGILRVIDKDAGKTCLGIETPISWNQTGPTGATGSPGPAGPAGAAGAQGPQGPKGDPGLRWRGAWNAGGAYSTGDVVSESGSSWVAILDPTAGYPPSTNLNEWSLVADQGAQGPAGPQGAAGPAGPQGPQGATGPQGPSGINLWAIVLGDGTLVASSGVASSSKFTDGWFHVKFNRDLDSCALVGTLRSLEPGEMTIYEGYAGDKSYANVHIFKSSYEGFPVSNPVRANRAFSVAAFC